MLKKKTVSVQLKEEQETRDYVKNISGNKIESETPKEEKKRIIIPVIETRKKAAEFDPLKLESRAEGPVIPLDHMAIQPVNDSEEKKNLPLLQRNLNPELLRIEDEQERFQTDVDSRPTEIKPDDMAYTRVPIQEYGTAILLGMGWIPGSSIGKNGRGISEPVVIEPRHYRLGLGAKKPRANQLPKQKKFIRPGDYRDPKEAERQKKKREGFIAGKLVAIVDGHYDGEYARVLTVDSVDNTINVQLQSTYEIITLEPEQLTIVDLQKLNKNHPALAFMKKPVEQPEEVKRERSDNDYSNPGSERKKSKHDAEVHGHHSKHKNSKHKRESSSSSSSSSDEDSSPWLMPFIRVRFINKKYGKGKYFNLKGTVVDVTKQKQCIFKLDSGELLEDIWQDMLESVVPGAGGRVMIVNGPYKGNFGLILEKKMEKQTADVQLLSGDDESDIRTLHLDNIAEYVGPDMVN